jgi:hypothetical protein
VKLKLILFFLLNCALSQAQKKSPITVSGNIGVGYEGYGLSRSPAGWAGYTPRQPWNQFRFNFAPSIKFNKNFSLPLNFNFITKPTNFAGPFAGLGSFGGKQSLGQFISNPSNNFSANPKYKWAELQLGTQFLNYSNLSTGDVAVFGAGVDLHPGNYIFKFFTGLSQQPINYIAPTLLPPNPGLPGAYRRSNWMMQLGKEKEGKYKVAFNFSKGNDHIKSLTPVLPPVIKPQEGFTVSFLTHIHFNKGWFFKTEIAQSYYTKNTNAPTTLLMKSFEPFLKARTSTQRDIGAELNFGKKLKTFEIGLSSKYLGAGFVTPGYPFMQPDRLDYTINTRFNAWKNKMNIVASAGQRVNNLSSTTTKATQFLGNLNWFTQFNDKFNLNITYNNFGFQAPGTTPFGVKNVSNDLGINPSYTWSNTKMINIISFSYNFSKYDERDILTNITTSNNTHTALLSYVPIFLKKKITPDFSLMYFYNKIPLPVNVTTTLITFNAGLGYPFAKTKGNLKAQLQYTLASNNVLSGNNNLIASCSVDYKITKKLIWRSFLSSNYLKYESGFTPPNASYLETQYRTGINYQFGKK